MVSVSRRVGLAAPMLSALLLSSASPAALAGGFDVREQSSYFQGMSFAGAAAGGSLSSMFWNPATAGEVGAGITMDSSYSLILPKADITAKSLDFGAGPIDARALGLDTTVDVGRDAVVPASYAAYRLNEQTVLAISMNSQFGLGTKPDNDNWVGSAWARSAKLVSYNGAPTIAYQLSSSITVAAGLQLQYIDLDKFKTGAPFAKSSVLEGDDFGVGFTAGIQLKPMDGTSIGVGFRSSIEHELEGSAKQIGAPPGVLSGPISADLELPEKVTASIRQDVAPNMRLLGTVEWTNWSRLGSIPVTLDGSFTVPPGVSPNAPAGAVLPRGATIATLDFNWEDGWFFSGGAEYDVNDKVTLRGGAAYEISPIEEPESRLVQLPDADRIWVSAGASYKWSESTTLNFAYSHVFVENETLDRLPASALAPAARLIADVDASVDIVSVGVTTMW